MKMNSEIKREEGRARAREKSQRSVFWVLLPHSTSSVFIIPCLWVGVEYALLFVHFLLLLFLYFFPLLQFTRYFLHVRLINIFIILLVEWQVVQVSLFFYLLSTLQCFSQRPFFALLFVGFKKKVIDYTRRYRYTYVWWIYDETRERKNTRNEGNVRRVKNTHT